MDSLTRIASALAPITAFLPPMDKLNGQFWSTLIGALVGGLLTFLMQMLNYRRTWRLEKAARRNADLTTGIAVLLKVSKMASNIWGIKRQMANALALAAAANAQGELSWQFVQPTVGRTPDVEFTDAERIFIVTRLQNDFVSVLELADAHNNLVDVLRIYSDHRIELGALMPGHAISGAMATTFFTEEQLVQLTPRMLSLQSLVAPLIARSKQDMAQAINVFASVRGVCVREFGKDFPALLVLDPAALADETPS